MIIENKWDWRTHQPLIHMAMKVFAPELVIELGMGVNSTPLFLSYSPNKLICIDNDKEWFDFIKSKYEFSEEYSTRFHKLSDSIINTTRIWEIEERDKINHFLYYIRLRNEISKNEESVKLLFVDNFACLRALAIDIMGSACDIILYHDCQPQGVFLYRYYFDKFKPDFDWYILKSPISWTGCFLSKQLIYTEEQLQSSIRPFIEKFCLDNELAINQMYLEKQT